MLRRPHPPHLRAVVLDRVAAGELLKDICAEPGMPSTGAVGFWARRDPDFAAALATAKARGAQRRRWAFREPTAKALLARLAAGARIDAILSDPAMPSRRVYDYWRATDAAFAEEVGRLNAVKAAEKVARCRRRLRPFDRALADRILARVAQGDALGRLLAADPALPSPSVLARWRGQCPEFDADLKRAINFARRRRLGDLRCTPELTDEIWARLLEGDSLAGVSLQPDMPCRATLYGWMRRRADFADAVADAWEAREDWLRDQALDTALRIGPTPEGRRRVGSLTARADRLRARWERSGRGG